MSKLHELAKAAGVQIDWENANSEPQRVADDDLRAVLCALGHEADSEAGVARSLTAMQIREPVDFFTTAIGTSVELDGVQAGAEAELELEDGTTTSLVLNGTKLPAIDMPGYHRLHIAGRTITIAVAPLRCFGIADITPGERLWGPAVQVPSLRGDAPSAFGDFGTLGEAARAFAGHGADAMAISPTHALFPADPSRFSPYAPSSRLFHNILFADPALAGGASAAERGGELIDWKSAAPRRLTELRAAFESRDDDVKSKVAAYRSERGKELERHAVFDALHAHFFESGARGWHDWPRAYHDPDSAAVASFARDHADAVDFYAFAQWLAEASLEAAQGAACDAGMAIGLISDLAVGMDGGGSHAWSRPGDLLTGLSIGAPPDPLGPQGQDWGITGFAPDALRRTSFAGFIDTLRAAIRSTGGIRIDHVLGLRRLWVVPHGAKSAQGAYVTMPLTDMLRIIAIESHRARAIVIGEDLGTVPEGLRPQLSGAGLMGMRVLWFERDKRGAFRKPRNWDDDAIAMTGTHDTPTAAGWWCGRDIDWREKLGQPKEDANEAREERATEKTRLWQAFDAAGLVEGSPPPPDRAGPVADAALAYVGMTPCPLAIVPIEDVAALVEQPNLPGTTDEHPNWRRRMPEATGSLIEQPDIAARIARLNKERRT